MNPLFSKRHRRLTPPTCGAAERPGVLDRSTGPRVQVSKLAAALHGKRKRLHSNQYATRDSRPAQKMGTGKRKAHLVESKSDEKATKENGAETDSVADSDDPDNCDSDSHSVSEWSDVDSDCLSDFELPEVGSSVLKETAHSRERREVWNSFKEPWMKVGYFMELGNRFSIVEKGLFTS